MTQWGFYFNQKRCLGCATCTVACKEWNEGRRGDAKLNALTENKLKSLETPKDWKAGTTDKAADYAFLRKFDMKENWRRVTFFEFGKRAPDVEVIPLSMSCNHCSDPACMKVCPVQAISKDKEFGAVLVDSSKCIGCGACAKACPWGAPQYFEPLEKTQMGTPEHPHMTKCDMCVDRLRVGLKPACVASCPGRALECGPIDELKKLHPKATFDAVGVPRKFVEQTKPNVLYTARKNFVK